MLMSFDTSSEVVAPLSDDTQKITASIRALRPGGGTALYDAVARSFETECARV